MRCEFQRWRRTSGGLLQEVYRAVVGHRPGPEGRPQPERLFQIRAMTRSRGLRATPGWLRDRSCSRPSFRPQSLPFALVSVHNGHVGRSRAQVVRPQRWPWRQIVTVAA